MNNIKNLDIKLCFGLSHMILYFLIFKNSPNINFNICMNIETFNNLRKGYDISYIENQLSFLLYLCKYYKLNNIYIKNNNNELNSLLINEWKLDNIKINLYDEFIPNIEIEYNNYIIINTKVSQIFFNDNELFDLWNNKLKSELCDIINKSNLKIILIGEKNMSNCLEYNIHRYFMIYNDLKNNISNNKIIDITDNNTIDLYEIDKIIKNMNIIKKAKFNISIGFSGCTILYTLLNNSLIFSHRLNFFDNYLSNTNYNEIYQNYFTINSDNFLNKLKEEVKK